MNWNGSGTTSITADAKLRKNEYRHRARTIIQSENRSGVLWWRSEVKHDWHITNSISCSDGTRSVRKSDNKRSEQGRLACESAMARSVSALYGTAPEKSRLKGGSMSIHQINLSGKDKVEVAIGRLQMFEPPDRGGVSPCIQRRKRQLRDKSACWHGGRKVHGSLQCYGHRPAWTCEIHKKTSPWCCVGYTKRQRRQQDNDVVIDTTEKKTADTISKVLLPRTERIARAWQIDSYWRPLGRIRE